jgi:hypothetical protein
MTRNASIWPTRSSDTSNAEAFSTVMAEQRHGELADARADLADHVRRPQVAESLSLSSSMPT